VIASAEHVHAGSHTQHFVSLSLSLLVHVFVFSQMPTMTILERHWEVARLLRLVVVRHGLKSKNGMRWPCGRGTFVPIRVPFVEIRSTNRALNIKPIPHLRTTTAFPLPLETADMYFIWIASNDG
jgi:hypothetical protein